MGIADMKVKFTVLAGSFINDNIFGTNNGVKTDITKSSF
jgi:hypothetical protein